jgi:hypothetical protein
MKRAMIAVLLALVAAGLSESGALAEQLDEVTATNLLSSKKPLMLKASTKTTRNARLRVHFWVGLDGDVEAVEQVCGEQALFDEIIDALLALEFKRARFTTDLSFLRRGRRVWLLLDLPAAQRPKRDICSAQALFQTPSSGFSRRLAAP